MRRSAVCLAVLLAGACGSGDRSTGGTTTAPEATTPLDMIELSAEACAALAADVPGPELVDALPAELRDAARALVEVADVAGGGAAAGVAASPALLDALVGPGRADELAALAAAADVSCGDAESATALAALSRAADLADLPADAAYCSKLAGFVGVDATFDPTRLGELITAAPDSHRRALESLRSLVGSDAERDPQAIAEVAAAFTGLGLYAESACGIEGAFTTMLGFGVLGGQAG